MKNFKDVPTIKLAIAPEITAKEANTSTVWFCDSPLCNNLWCKCSASGVNGDTPFAILLKEENVMSTIGTARIKNGTNIVNSGDFITPVIDKVASKNPANNEPESPIKILAG